MGLYSFEGIYLKFLGEYFRQLSFVVVELSPVDCRRVNFSEL